MPLLQSVEGCLEGGIGASGLSQAELDSALDRLKPRLASLRDDYATGALPLLRVQHQHAARQLARFRGPVKQLQRAGGFVCHAVVHVLVIG